MVNSSCLEKPRTIAKISSPPYVPIPHIIHQSWKTTVLPKKFQVWQMSWKNSHSDWKYILWTDDDNMRLCEEHFPWMLKRFKEMPTTINRADTARYMYMYKYGGFYADLDLECLKSHTPIAKKGGVVVPLMSRDYNFVHNIPNPWMGSIPGHPFWLFLLKKIKDRPITTSVELLTGPIVLYEALKEFDQQVLNESIPPITYIAPEWILPYDWHNMKGLGHICSAQSERFNPIECKKNADPNNQAFAFTYWSHSWGSNGTALMDIPFKASI
ncbi:hypothetical protein BDV3_005201 [Batrachochytrium dendrobatidis]